MPPGVDYALPAAAFVVIWGGVGMLGSMVGLRRSGLLGFALGAVVAGGWLLYLAGQYRHAG